MFQRSHNSSEQHCMVDQGIRASCAHGPHSHGQSQHDARRGRDCRDPQRQDSSQQPTGGTYTDEAYRGSASTGTKRAAAPPPPKSAKANKGGGKGTHTGPQMANGLHLCNRKRFPLCDSFNSSTGCDWNGPGLSCGYNSAKVHQCAKCLGTNHGASTCGEQSKNTTTAANKRRKGRFNQGKGGK